MNFLSIIFRNIDNTRRFISEAEDLASFSPQFCKQYIKDALRAEHLDESTLDCSVNDIRRQRLWDTDVTVIMDVKYDNAFGGKVCNEIRFLVSRKGEIHECLVM